MQKQEGGIPKKKGKGHVAFCVDFLFCLSGGGLLLAHSVSTYGYF